MKSSTWSEETIRFAGLSGHDRWRWFARLLRELTMMARSTYTPGGLGLDHPERMRRLNELTHRVAEQFRNNIDGISARPDEIFIKIVSEECDALKIDSDQLLQQLQQSPRTQS
jgi:hypothetical protein